MADLATLKARLDEAETALHYLMIGRREVSVGHGDKQVTYSKATEDKLRSYIQRLKNDIALLEGRSVRRTAYPWPL
ncbi:MAG: gpW family protein [Deltaproteobacteria bacterium]|nr:gpW family protein [Deltaproteobacteria bacterium]